MSMCGTEGSCDLHKLIVCSCGGCKGEKITCTGEKV